METGSALEKLVLAAKGAAFAFERIASAFEQYNKLQERQAVATEAAIELQREAVGGMMNTARLIEEDIND